MAQEPDVVVLTGDFVHKGFRHVRAAAASVARLSAPHGVYAVLGNHDHAIRSTLGIPRYRHLHWAVADALTGHGVRVLRNETVTIVRGGAELYLTGLDQLASPRRHPELPLGRLRPALPRPRPRPQPTS